MGKSWLTAVKRAFRSPNKDTHKKSKTRDDPEREDQDQDKRDRRRWIFRKPTNQETLVSTQMKVKPSSTADQAVSVEAVAATTDQKHSVAVAVVTTQAPTEAARLNNHGIGRDGKQDAAIVIQTAFRGYLARRALRALKGLVKLQALVRGHNVRKQAKMTLRCMQALVRLQSRVLDNRTRFSHEGGSSSRISTFSKTNSPWESPYLQGISDRKSLPREGSSIASDWDERPHTVEEVKAMLHKRKEAAMKRDKSLSQAFSQRIWRNGNEDELEERPKRLERWMTMKPWESNRGRASTDRRDPIKTVEIDTSQPYSYLGPNYRRSHPNYQYNPQSHQTQTQSHIIASPRHRTNQNVSIQHSPATPSPAKSRPIQVRSASPCSSREDRSYHTSQTPNLRLNNHTNNNNNNHHHNYSGNAWLSSRAGTSSNGRASLPNYMAATESAKARIRSQSAPRQRPPTPERDRVGSARKRLSYPAHNIVGIGYGHSLRSPSFRSVSGSHFGLEHQSNYSSCCTDSLAGEISPSSTGDLRRWLG